MLRQTSSSRAFGRNGGQRSYGRLSLVETQGGIYFVRTCGNLIRELSQHEFILVPPESVAEGALVRMTFW